MSIPILFFHYGNPYYLKYTLKQARYFNPDSPIYLLGDEKNNRYPFVTHVSASKYDTEAAAFTKIYKHRSSNNESYELNCFLRWFYIKAFCLENNIESFIYLDSDVLAFQDFSQLVPLFKPCKIANTDSTTGVPAFTYFNDYKAIDDFCNYLIYSYSNKTAIAKIEAWYKPFAAIANFSGGVSDMILFHFYDQEHPGEVIKVDLINNAIAIDVSINLANGYEMEGVLKKVYWKNKLPYCKSLTSGNLVRFASLHYQGNATKIMILKHYKANGYAIQRVWKLFKVGYKAKVKKLKKAIKTADMSKTP